MKIIRIEEFSKSKCKLIMDNMTSIVLYKTDLRRYDIAEGKVLADKQLELLTEEILPYRAKMRCMKLLQSRDYTEQEIRKKLTADGYPERVIDGAIEYLYRFHYLDDERYVRLYYQCKSNKKSKKQIQLDLQQKGVDKNIIVSVLNEFLEERKGAELECIRTLLRKKKYLDCEATYEEKEKVKAYLFRKGFEINDINVCMRNFSWENV